MNWIVPGHYLGASRLEQKLPDSFYLSGPQSLTASHCDLGFQCIPTTAIDETRARVHVVEELG